MNCYTLHWIHIPLQWLIQLFGTNIKATAQNGAKIILPFKQFETTHGAYMETFGFMMWIEAKGEKESGNVANIMRAENKRRKNLHKSYAQSIFDSALCNIEIL